MEKKRYLLHLGNLSASESVRNCGEIRYEQKTDLSLKCIPEVVEEKI